jgi:hypothetical protein
VNGHRQAAPACLKSAHDRTFAQGCGLAFIIIDDKGNDFFTELNLG